MMKDIENDINALISSAKKNAYTQEIELPEYIQLELDFMDEMFLRRIQDPRA